MQLIVNNIFRLLLEVISNLQINMFSIYSRRDSGILLGVISIYKSMFSCFFFTARFWHIAWSNLKFTNQCLVFFHGEILAYCLE